MDSPYRDQPPAVACRRFLPGSGFRNQLPGRIGTGCWSGLDVVILCKFWRCSSQLDLGTRQPSARRDRPRNRPPHGGSAGAPYLPPRRPFARAPEIPAVTGRWSVSGFVSLSASFLRRRSKSRSPKKLPVSPPGPCQIRGAPGGLARLSVHLPAPVRGSTSPPGT